MPSRYEPCGLNQLYSLKYGTVPVVHATGGLADTITNLTDATLAAGTANGFSFDNYTPVALAQTLERACQTYLQPPGLGATHPHRHVAGLVLEPQRPRIQPTLRAGPLPPRQRSPKTSTDSGRRGLAYFAQCRAEPLPHICRFDSRPCPRWMVRRRGHKAHVITISLPHDVEAASGQKSTISMKWPSWAWQSRPIET